MEEDRSQIVEFYNDQTLFITGVTGFLGKTLLWQVLDRCSGVKKVYVLVRGKRGKPSQDRFYQDVISQSIFESIFSREPRLRDILEVVEGDISIENLGMDPETRKRMQEEVTVVLHCAATVKFNEEIKLSIELNTQGARRMLEFSKGCRHIVSHVHVSTAYVNCIHKSGDVEIREKIYPLNVDPEDFMKRISLLTPEQANKQTEQLIYPYPNTYTFTKALGENFILLEKEDTPVCIVRPAIVGCAYKTPVPGWVDSMGGASGLLASLGVGALHTMKGRGSNVADFIPVDFVSATIIAAAWRTAKQYGTYPHLNEVSPMRQLPSLPIYHSASSTKNPVLWSWMASIIGGYFRRHPTKRNMGTSVGFYIPNRKVHFISHLLLHLFPASLADGKRLIQGKPVRMVKSMKQLHVAISTLSFFTDYQWFYSSENVDQLLSEMNKKDKKLFEFDLFNLNWELYFVIYAEGIRKFLLKEIGDYNDDLTQRIRSKL